MDRWDQLKSVGTTVLYTFLVAASGVLTTTQDSNIKALLTAAGIAGVAAVGHYLNGLLPQPPTAQLTKKLPKV